MRWTRTSGRWFAARERRQRRWIDTGKRHCSLVTVECAATQCTSREVAGTTDDHSSNLVVVRRCRPITRPATSYQPRQPRKKPRCSSGTSTIWLGRRVSGTYRRQQTRGLRRLLFRSSVSWNSRLPLCFTFGFDFASLLFSGGFSP